MKYFKIFEDYKHIGDETIYNALSREDFFKTMLTNTKEAENWILELLYRDLGFHIDDDPEDIINRDGERIFTDKEADLIRERLEEIYKYVSDPFDFLNRNVSDKYQGSALTFGAKDDHEFEIDQLHRIDHMHDLFDFHPTDNLEKIIEEAEHTINTEPNVYGVKIKNVEILNDKREDVIWYKTKDMKEGKFTKYYHISIMHDEASQYD